MSQYEDRDGHEPQPQPYNARSLQSTKRRRRLSPNRPSSSRSSSDTTSPSAPTTSVTPIVDSTPRQTPSLPPKPPTPTATSSSTNIPDQNVSSQKRKRPGTRTQMTSADREAWRKRQEDRERQVLGERGSAPLHHNPQDAVREHYNNVPQRGREWRKTDSRIKGLRAYNNWVKSSIIQKFSPERGFIPGSGGQKSLSVLDIGCGKGGDLGKWQQAPQTVELYVGLDPADVSIQQASERYRSMRNGGGGGRGGHHHRRPPPRIFRAFFETKDCFGESIEDIEIVHQVGFDPSPLNRRGFDVVSMMFCLHYAFESEEKARTMLRNVAGALTKGGRFIGCIPNSHVLSKKVRSIYAARKTEDGKTDAMKEEGVEKDDNKESSNKEGEEGETEEVASGIGEKADDNSSKVNLPIEWGNDLHRVRFASQPPEDGIFRPAFGWKYNFFLDEAVEEVPEYVVPWEAFRALAEDYNLELEYHSPFGEIWDTDQDDPSLGPLSERMGVRERGRGRFLVTDAEMEVANIYAAFCFYKV